MTINTLDDLFHETLKDLYYAEKKLVKTLPKMAKQATSPTLKEAIEHHLNETESHVTRLEEVFGTMGKKPTSKKCEALEGLVKEAEEVLAEIEDGPTIDAAIISSSQTVEHYEIARYGTLVCWARQLGLKDAEFLLQKTLDEEQTRTRSLPVSPRNTSIRKQQPDQLPLRMKKERPIGLSFFCVNSRWSICGAWTVPEPALPCPPAHQQWGALSRAPRRFPSQQRR